MSDEQIVPSSNTVQVLIQTAFSVALLGAVGGLVFELLTKNPKVTPEAPDPAVES